MTTRRHFLILTNWLFDYTDYYRLNPLYTRQNESFVLKANLTSFGFKGVQRGVIRRTINEDSQYVQVKPRMNGTAGGVKSTKSKKKSIFSVGKFRYTKSKINSKPLT